MRSGLIAIKPATIIVSQCFGFAMSTATKKSVVTTVSTIIIVLKVRDACGTRASPQCGSKSKIKWEAKAIGKATSGDPIAEPITTPVTV